MAKRRKRISFFVDGFNLYFALLDCSKADPRHPCFKWFDLPKFLQQFIDPNQHKIEDIYYFSAYYPWASNKSPLTPDPTKEARHKLYRAALEHFGVKTVFGHFRHKPHTCSCCGGYEDLPEEKQTDVSIGVTMVKLALQNKYDIGVLVSGDTDLIPAVEAIKELHPKKLVGVLCPFNRANKAYQSIVTYRYSKTYLRHYKNCLFPRSISRADGSVITCPPTWQ
jgi:uncharacterized LabA/DUF88 family protein